MLLAEDNLINQAVARKMLTSLGMTCEVACNGEEAVTAVKASMAPGGAAFDIVLMDMSMPIMGGVEATQVCLTLAKRVDQGHGSRGRSLCCGLWLSGWYSCKSQGQHGPGGPAFDIVLMDMSMPIMGGVEATQVRKAPLIRHLLHTHAVQASNNAPGHQPVPSGPSSGCTTDHQILV